MNGRDVAVVGMACVYPGATDLLHYWRNIVNGVDAIGELPGDRWPGSRNVELPPDHDAHIGCRRGGFIESPYLFDAVRFKVMPSIAANGDVDQFILLGVLADALEDAGIGWNDPRRANTDVIVGRGGYTSNKMMDLFLRADLIDRLQRYLSERLPRLTTSEIDGVVAGMKQHLGEPDPDSMATSIPNLVASRAANRLNLRGCAYNVDAACASSLLAVEHSMRRLREGLCDVALACGINFTHVPTFWYLFTRILALSPSGSMRPFDRRADGLLIGEGAGAVVLKRLEDARRDEDRIYAVVRGAGSASDGNDVGVLAPSAAGQVRALERAYFDAGLDPDTIGLLEAHGTATQQGDQTEIESTRSFFGARRNGHATRVMGSVKSMIGHTMPAAGIASFIKTALALSNKVIPPSLHCEQPHEGLLDLPFYVSSRARPWIQDRRPGPRRAGVNAFGFGGINVHVVLEEVTPTRHPGLERLGAPLVARPPDVPRPLNVREACPGLRRPSELLAFADAGPAEMARRLHRAARFVREDLGGFRPEELAHSLAREVDGKLPCRLAVVAGVDEGLPGRLEALAARLETDGMLAPDQQREAFFSREAMQHSGRIAALFPGHAFPGLLGDYPDHLMTLCLHFPAAREVFDGVEARDRHPEDPLPTSMLLQPPDHLPEDERRAMRHRFAAWVTADGTPESPKRVGALRPDERLLAAMGVLTSNEASWKVLEPFGIPFDMACGQSLGDVSALCAAGCVEFDVAMGVLWGYLSVDLRAENAGCLALVWGSAEKIAPVLERLGDTEIAIHLSPENVVVGGPDEEIAELGRMLREMNVMCQVLPFPPIHTRRLRERQLEFAEAYRDPIPLEKPRFDVYSALTTKPLAGEADELRRQVFSNLSYPIRFWQTLRRMYEDGARTFIQIGPGNLAGNARGVLPDDAATLSVDLDHRDPLTQLHHLLGSLFAKGVPLDLQALFGPGSPRELPLDVPRPRPQPPRGAVPLTLYWPPLQVGSEHDRPAAGLTTPTAPMPFVGEVLELEPGRRIVQVRRFELDEDLYLADHTFVGEQHGKPAAERFPVVPLTVTLEMLAETASCLFPDLRVIGFERVRARRWMTLDGVEHLDVRVEAETESDDDGVRTVRVEAFANEAPVATARVRLSDRYRIDVDLQFSELADVRPFPIAVERLYSDHHFFHGPRFQCVKAIRSRGRQGVLGEIAVHDPGELLRSRDRGAPLLDPVALDGAGQMLGTMFFDRGVYILPVAVDKIEFYRPSPPPGTRVPVRVEVTEYNADERRVAAIMEVQDGSGNVWFRISGWQDRVFRYSKQLLRAQRQPARHTLSDERPLAGVPAGGVAMALPRSALRDAHPAAVARIYLSDTEWPRFEAAGSDRRRQIEWLMGRIAAKDAVRRWLCGPVGSPLLHPSRLVIENDSQGCPEVSTPDSDIGRLPRISIAHKDSLAIAVAADRAVGIDVEPDDGGKNLQLEDFAAPAEIESLERMVGRQTDWATRLWCGKEAAAKALGTGLQGRPRAFKAVEIDADGRLVVENGEPSRRVQVHTSRTDGWTFAVASIPTDGPGR